MEKSNLENMGLEELLALRKKNKESPKNKEEADPSENKSQSRVEQQQGAIAIEDETKEKEENTERKPAANIVQALPSSMVSRVPESKLEISAQDFSKTVEIKETNNSLNASFEIEYINKNFKCNDETPLEDWFNKFRELKVKNFVSQEGIDELKMIETRIVTKTQELNKEYNNSILMRLKSVAFLIIGIYLAIMELGIWASFPANIIVGLIALYLFGRFGEIKAEIKEINKAHDILSGKNAKIGIQNGSIIFK